MKFKDCKLDVRVGFINKYNTTVLVGRVAGICKSPNNDMTIVEWDSSYVEKVFVKNLLPEAEAIEEVKILLFEKNKLEQEFKMVRVLVEQKMKAAAALVDEAQKLVIPYNKSLYDLNHECADFISAIEDVGWSASRASC